MSVVSYIVVAAAMSKRPSRVVTPTLKVRVNRQQEQAVSEASQTPINRRIGLRAPSVASDGGSVLSTPSTFGGRPRSLRLIMPPPKRPLFSEPSWARDPGGARVTADSALGLSNAEKEAIIAQAIAAEALRLESERSRLSSELLAEDEEEEMEDEDEDEVSRYMTTGKRARAPTIGVNNKPIENLPPPST